MMTDSASGQTAISTRQTTFSKEENEFQIKWAPEHNTELSCAKTKNEGNATKCDAELVEGRRIATGKYIPFPEF